MAEKDSKSSVRKTLEKDSMSCLSTQVPQEPLSDSGDSMETGPSSKMSNSRPERERGPKRKEKKLKRAQKYHEEQGLAWKDKEQLKQNAAELAFPGLKGSVAPSMHDHILEQKKNEPTPAGDEKLKAIEDALVKEIPVEMCKWVQMVNGEPRCLICDKVATEGHLQSSEHLKRIEEDAIGTLMGGKALTPRRFNGDKCTGVATKKRCTTFGEMPWKFYQKAAKEIHLKKGVFL